MSYHIVQRNIIKSSTDAIVNTANQKPVCTPGTEMEIYQAAGFDTLLRERQKAGNLSPGDVFTTLGFGLKTKTIFHVVLPSWNHTNPPDYDLIRKCYRNIFSAAKKAEINSLSMPVLGLEKYGFFGKKAMDIAIDETEAFLKNSPMNISLCAEKDRFVLLGELADDIDDWLQNDTTDSDPAYHYRSVQEAVKGNGPEESFGDLFFRLVDEKGWTDAEVYHRANVDRRIISRLRSDPDSGVARNTAISLAISLHLTLDEAKDFTALAGWAFQKNSKFDRIIQYFLAKQKYNMAEINETLFAYCGKCLTQ